MHKAQEQVREFHREVVGAPTSPAELEIRQGALRARLLIKEAIETVFALVGPADGQSIIQAELLKVLTAAAKKRQDKPDLIEAIDGLCDVVVIAYGTAEAIGIDLEPFFDEVHRSNMAKKGGPVVEGKLLKPPGWTPPDIAGVLRDVKNIHEQVQQHFGDADE